MRVSLQNRCEHPVSYPVDVRVKVAFVMPESARLRIGRPDSEWDFIEPDEAVEFMRQRFGDSHMEWLLRQLLKGHRIPINGDCTLRLAHPFNSNICSMCGGARRIDLVAGLACTPAVCPSCNSNGLLPYSPRYPE